MRFGELEDILQKDGIVFLSYGGFLTQSLIVSMTDALEKEAVNTDMSMKISGNIFTIFIEIAQNIMNYTKTKKTSEMLTNPDGLIMIGTNNENSGYYVIGRNIIEHKDKLKIEKRLQALEGLNKEELRKLYRENRKSGKDKHSKGAGIGFIEIARRCDEIEYKFTEHKDESKYYFTLKAIINNNDKENV
jgi:hypothetical protein